MNIKWRIATSEADREAVYRLRARGYGKHYRHIPRGRFVDAIDSATLPDNTPRSRSVLVEKDGNPVGTGRSVLAYSPELPNFVTELDFLFDVTPEALLKKLTRQANIHFDSYKIGELSRFTVMEKQHSDEVFRNVMAGFVSLADFYEVDVYICAMTEWLKQRFVPLNMIFKRMDGFNLQRDDPDALWYMTRYYDYFFPRLSDVLPDVERKMFSDKRWITNNDLRAIVDGCYPEDIISLYWITPEEIHRAVKDYMAQSAAHYRLRSQNYPVRHLKELKATVFSGLKQDHEVINPFSIHERDAKHYFQNPYTGQIVMLPEHDTFYHMLTSRNYPLLSSDEQQCLRHARIGIAGQGTVGGNLTIAMTRYGFEHFRTSDPDYFDVSNLNRQAAGVFGIGYNKADWVAHQASCINPFVDIDIFEPITEDNVRAFVDECDIVISALDNPRLILQLNHAAMQQRTPVLLGTDLGTKVLLDIFDYRQTDQLLNGRATLEDMTMPPMSLVLKIVGVENISAEMLQALHQRMRGEIDYFAQTVVAASVCSSMLIKGVSALLLNKPLKTLASIDIMDAILPDDYQQEREARRIELADLLQQEII